MNVNAGGGSTLTLPVLIFLGLDAATANGTNRVAIFLQTASAVYSFKKENYQQFPVSIKLSLLTLPGAVIGAILSVRISDELFETILGIIMIVIIITMLVPNKKNIYKDGETGERSWLVYLSMLGIGFYGGFIQVGVGFILMAALHYLMKLNLVYVNMHKVFIVLIYTFPALLVFIFTDNVNWIYGICLAAGTAFGGWWGAKLSVRKGEKLIKAVLIVAVLVMSFKLWGVF
ncbi:MAG: sulfite exporter TauE/SafE family protein [Melioribacteraceae bacterium]|nr:sulfite exporter TauE/SafE family protein [Melioribacteraceae bacterium]